MSIVSALINLCAKPARLKALLSYGHKGYLSEIGWFKAFDSQSAVDAEGNPIPWVTYSFIDFVTGKINKSHRIFEFGSGNSTLYYAKHAGGVVSVEHDKAWFEKIVSTKPSNSEMIYSELQPNGAYCKMPTTLDEKFHIIIVDGRDRVNCCKNSLTALTSDGIVVLDDSERADYVEGRSFFQQNGFKELLLSGISPGLFYRKSTSIFYKQENCLGI